MPQKSEDFKKDGRGNVLQFWWGISKKVGRQNVQNWRVDKEAGNKIFWKNYRMGINLGGNEIF